jgi:hypothetical protein
VLQRDVRWKSSERLKLVYDADSGSLSFFRNDVLLHTAVGVPGAGMYAAVSSGMGSMRFKSLQNEQLGVSAPVGEEISRFSDALNRAIFQLKSKSCGPAHFISIIRLISALDNRKTLNHLKSTARPILAPAASQFLLSMSKTELESLFGLLSVGDIGLIEIVAEMLALQPLQDVMIQFIPLIKSVSLDLLRGKSKCCPSGLTYLSLLFERVCRGLFFATLAAFNTLTATLGRNTFQTLNTASTPSASGRCEIILIPRWVLEDVDPVRAYAQVLTFGNHRVAAVLGLGWADIRVAGQLHRITAVQAQILWMITVAPELTNRRLSELCHISDDVLAVALSELISIGAVSDSRSTPVADDAPTVMGSAQLPRTSIHTGSACINAVFWLCKRMKEASGVLDELEACDACSSATGSPPAVVVSVVIDLIRRGIFYRQGGYLFAPAAGGDEARIASLPPSAMASHSSASSWQLIPPFERLVLVRMDETAPACHSFISSSFSSACIPEGAFREDLTATLSQLVQHCPGSDILAISNLFQDCGSVISFAASSVFSQKKDAVFDLPAISALSLSGTCSLCLDEKELVAAPCGHARCQTCFTEYFSTAIQDSQTPARALGNAGLSITKLKCTLPPPSRSMFL